MTPAAIVLGGYLAVLATLFVLSRRHPGMARAIDDLRWSAAASIAGGMAAVLSRSVPWPVTAVLILVSVGLIGYGHRRDGRRQAEGKAG